MKGIYINSILMLIISLNCIASPANSVRERFKDMDAARCMKALGVPEGDPAACMNELKFPTSVTISNNRVYNIVSDEKDRINIYDTDNRKIMTCGVTKFNSEREARRYPFLIRCDFNSMSWRLFAERKKEAGRSNPLQFSFEDGILILSIGQPIYMAYKNTLVRPCIFCEMEIETIRELIKEIIDMTVSTSSKE